jgi:REP element-mobilizing transposase RayT
MARRLRLHVPGGFYHVTLRGNHRQPIFFSHADRDLLDVVVAEALNQLSARLHAYCWMTNHIHLLVQVADAPLGRLMMRIASRYARSVQASLGTTGHLFERRYHDMLVDADNYLLTLIRYIHLNPVRAGLVADPAAYPWSSHRSYLDVQHRPWLTTGFALRLLTVRPKRALARYRAFMGVPDDSRWGTGMLMCHAEHPQILGSDAFVAKAMGDSYIASPPRSLEELMRECCERFQVTLQALGSPSRARPLAAARAWLGHQAVAGRVASICAVARRLQRSEGAIRQAMRRHPLDPTDE